MFFYSHVLSSHSPTPSIPVYTTCVRFRHLRLRPRHSHPRHRVCAFKPRVRPRCPRPRHPRARIQHLCAHNPRSHVQARCLASSGLDTYAGQRKRACRCRRCGTVVGRDADAVRRGRWCCSADAVCRELPESPLLYLLYLVHLTL